MREALIKYSRLMVKLYVLTALVFFTLLIMSITIPGVGVLTLTTAYSVLDGIEKAQDACITKNKK